MNTLTDDRDGATYKTVQIGDQCWLAENLRYLPSVSPIMERSPARLWRSTPVNSRTRPFCYVYGHQGRRVSEAKATANYRNYGVLYNWPAAMEACPRGWHLPSDAEWTQLVDYLVDAYGLLNDWGYAAMGRVESRALRPGIEASAGFSGQQRQPAKASTPEDHLNICNYVGDALKSRRQIDSPLGGHCDTSEHPRWASIHTPPPERKTVAVNIGSHYGTDQFGFAALPGGRCAYGAFTELGFIGFWWSSTEYYATRAWYRFMRHEFGDVTRSTFDKAAGLSVRCVRD